MEQPFEYFKGKINTDEPKAEEELYEKKEKLFPVGESKSLEKEFLPALEVKNHVLWVNPGFEELPLKLKEGEPTKLGLFFTPAAEITEKKHRLNILGLKLGKQDVTKKLETKKIEIMGSHYRSGVIGRAIFKDKEGRFYRDIDLKGIGCFDISQKVVTPHPLEGYGEKAAAGILNLDLAEKDRFMTEKFLRDGVRTCRVATIISIEEIVTRKGQQPWDPEWEIPEKISVDEAKKRGQLPQKEEPVVMVRAFGTKARLVNTDDSSVEDARILVAQELGRPPKEFGVAEYFKWLAKNIGKNVGLMHKLGWSHGYLSQGHNITLDARIVDLDSVSQPKKNAEDAFRIDMESVMKAVYDFLNFRQVVPELREEIISELQAAYLEERQN